MCEKSILKGRIWRTVLMALAMAVSGAWAETVTRDEAARAVGNWLALGPQLGCRLGASVSGARTCSTTNGVVFHVVKLDGGGFVVTSADTEREPIVAFSESDDLVESDRNPLWVMLGRDFAAQTATARQTRALTANAATASARASASPASVAARKWARLLPKASAGGTVPMTYASNGLDTISDERVAPLLETKWNQSQDSLYSNRGDPCYNYYTPNNWPCGCVATATAQLMRYHRYPTASVTPGTYACAVGGVSRDLTMQGGTYDWANMPAVPADGTTLAQRQAIGKLTSDIGISCLAKYGSGSSSIGGYMPVLCLPERFGYASALAVCNSGGLAADLVQRVLRSNLDAKLPVIAGLSGSGGHAVVADGYGYSMSTFYVHLNMGWGGTDDAWYALPDVTTSWYTYWSIHSLVFNVRPTGEADGVICSGRILDSDGSPLRNATVTAKGATTVTATSDARGVYAFVLSPGTYRISSGNASRSVTLEANAGTHVYANGMYSVSPYAVNNLCDVDLTVTGDEPAVVTHAVTFDLGEHGTRTGGGELTQTVADGAAAVEPTFTVASGWSFVGWSCEFSKVTGDLTVYAQYGSEPEVPVDGTHTQTVNGIEWVYTIQDGIAILGYNHGSYPLPADIAVSATGKITIPPEFDGCPLKVIGANAFCNGANLTEIVIPDSVTSIEMAAFYGCCNLVAIELPPYLERIGTCAFESCEKLVELKIPAHVEQIDGSAFGWCTSLQNIFVLDGNETYTSRDGVLLSKDGSILVAFPGGRDEVAIPQGVVKLDDCSFRGGIAKRIRVPECVQTLGEAAFEHGLIEELVFDSIVPELPWAMCSDCHSLVKVVLPDGLVKIGGAAFGWCYSLETIVIPKGVTTIEEWAFRSCGSLTRVDFAGAPPTDVESEAFLNVRADCVGTYPAAYAAEWARVIDGDGMWNGLRMEMVGSSQSEMQLALSPGWNWISLNVAPTDGAIDAVFSGATFVDEDVIKSAEGSATYYGGKWYGELTTIKPGVAYMVRMSAVGSQTLTVTGSAAATSVDAVSGWNWIGPTATAEVSLDALTHSDGFADEDVIKSAATSATYYGGKWYGELKSLKPGVGYEAKFAKGGTLAFGK